MFEKLKAWFLAHGVTISSDQETALKTEIEKLEKVNPTKTELDLSKLDLSKFKDDETKKVVETLTNQNTVLTQRVNDLISTIAKEQQARDAATKAAQEDAKKAFDKKVSVAVQKLFDDKKITEAQKEDWKKSFEASFDSASKIAEGLKPLESKSSSTSNKQQTTTGEPDNKFVKPNYQSVAELIRTQMKESE